MKDPLTLLLLISSAVCQAQSITWTRDGKPVKPTCQLSKTPVVAGQQARAFLDSIRKDIKRDDVLLCSGELDFGTTHTLYVPECILRSDPANPARWLTHLTIDRSRADAWTIERDATGKEKAMVAVQDAYSKRSSMCGFSVGKFARFEQMTLAGECWNAGEDGGLVGFDPVYEGPGVAEFEDCIIDGSQGHDWTFYNWKNAERTFSMKGGKLFSPRFGVAMAASGGGANQTVILDGVEIYLDANGSRSIGESSRNDPESGGVLAAVLNRGGSVTIRDCSVRAIGLREPYDQTGTFGCPRIAALGTNWYYQGASKTDWTVERCRVKIEPGNAKQVSDIDLRGDRFKFKVSYDEQAIAAAEAENAKRLAEARGGSNEDGTLKVWKPEVTK